MKSKTKIKKQLTKTSFCCAVGYAAGRISYIQPPVLMNNKTSGLAHIANHAPKPRKIKLPD